MYFKSIVSAGLLMLAASSSAIADSNFYVGGNYSFLDYSITSVDDAQLGTLDVRAGTFFNSGFSGEVRLGFGVSDDTVYILNSTKSGYDSYDFSLDYFAGAYLRSGVLTSGNFFPYLIAGVTTAEVSTKSATGTGSRSETDLSFGIGIDYTVKNTVTVNAEYINYISKNSVDISGFTLGIAKRF